MDDARELQYGIEFETEEAEGGIDALTQKVDDLEKRLGAVEMGAQQIGAGAVSACQTAQGAIERFTGAVGGAADGLDEITDSAGAAGSAAGSMAGHWDMTAQGLEWVEEAAQAAGAATRDLGDGLDDAGGDADDFRAKIRKAAEEADDLGDAFRTTMADGLEAGQSITKSFGTGLTGALDFSKNKFKGFVTDTVNGAKKIGTAITHPVQTIRTNLVKALRRAREAEDDVGDGAEDAEKDLDDMGDAGEEAGSSIKEAISGAIGAFVGFEAIKQGIELLKEFGASAIEAFTATENTSAKFDRTFSDDAAAWVDNYSDAVHRSTAEVQGFMVQNQAMYRNMGMTAEAAEGLSEITTSLAYDFGNAFSMADADAAALIQSAIQGDTQALTEYGIVLDETALKNSAAALGLGTNIDELDDAAAAQVRLNAILEQSTDIQQAAINSTGGLVNSTKSLNGIWSEFLSDAGGKFAPAVEDIANSVLDVWPEMEPMLLSFVDVLSDGLGDVVPVLVQLGKQLIPTLSSTLGTVMEVAGPLIDVVGSLAGTVLPPLANIFSEIATIVLPPLLDIIEELNTSVIQPLMPVVEELASQLLPVFGMALSAVASAVGPLAQAIMPLITTLLPPLASIISELAGAIIPPLTQILGVVTTALTPIIDLATQLVQAILPAAEPLISAVSTVLSGVVLPVLEALSPALSFVSDVLGTVVGWVADLIEFFSSGVSKVVDWFAGLFGGAKESTGAVEELTGAVTDLDGAAGQETSLAIDTSEYTNDVSAASQGATEAVTEAVTAAREISDTNYTLMADDAETAYSRMTLDAEEAWERMTAAATTGATNIVAQFQRIASAAQSVSGANISVTGVSVPGNAEGTDDWEGGWTRMNEEGGELAYLPSGTAIIPADKTDEIINNSTSSSEYVDSSTFAPQISISIGEGGAQADPDDIAQKVQEMMEKFWREKKEEEYHKRAMQGAYAR